MTWGIGQITAVAMALASLVLIFVSEGRLNRLCRHPQLEGQGPLTRRALIRFGFARESTHAPLRREIRMTSRALRLGMLLFVGAVLLWFRRSLGA
jgi:hypothetical protein